MGGRAWTGASGGGDVGRLCDDPRSHKNRKEEHVCMRLCSGACLLASGCAARGPGITVLHSKLLVEWKMIAKMIRPQLPPLFPALFSLPRLPGFSRSSCRHLPVREGRRDRERVNTRTVREREVAAARAQARAPARALCEMRLFGPRATGTPLATRRQDAAAACSCSFRTPAGPPRRCAMMPALVPMAQLRRHRIGGAHLRHLSAHPGPRDVAPLDRDQEHSTTSAVPLLPTASLLGACVLLLAMATAAAPANAADDALRLDVTDWVLANPPVAIALAALALWLLPRGVKVGAPHLRHAQHPAPAPSHAVVALLMANLFAGRRQGGGAARHRGPARLPGRIASLCRGRRGAGRLPLGARPPRRPQRR